MNSRVLMIDFKALLRGLELLSTCIEKILTLSGVVMLVGMWGLLLLNTVSRWMTQHTNWDVNYAWSLEIVGFMVAWSIFVMMGPVAKWDMHIKVGYFPMKLLGEKRGEIFIRTIENMAGLAVGIFLSIHCYRLILYTMNSPLERTRISVGGWEYPMGIVRAGLFVGFVTMSFFYFNRIIKEMVRYVGPEEKAGGHGNVTTTGE